jgi:signal transduction histidine kinase
MDSYEAELRKSRDELSRLTKTFSDHIELTFLAVDVVLKRAIEKEYFNKLFGSTLQKNTQNNIVIWVDETPQISAMLIADELGNVTDIYRKEGYKLWMEGNDNIFDKGYFSYHRENYDELYVGRQQSFMSSSDGFILLSRRINNIDGSFGGVILAAINSDYISGFYNSVQNSADTSFMLLDGVDNSLIHSDLFETAMEKKKFYDVIKQQSPARNISSLKIYQNDESFDGLKLYAFENIPSIKMRIIVNFSGSYMLQKWYSERFSDAVFYLIFLVFVFIIGFFTIELAKKVQKLRVSERKALTASKAKSDFLAGMSHELRTPLNAIIGFSEMLNSGYFGPLNDKQRERLSDINSCGNHLLSLINDILEYSKGQAHKLQLNSEEFSMKKLIAEVVRLFQEKAGNAGIELRFETPKNLPYLFADKRKVKQILLNLLSNSIKFCQKGDLIEVKARLSDTGAMLLSVRDTGIGMDEADIPKAMNEFTQIHNDAAIGGTGLGLPLCKMFAELHEGKVEIRSKVGKGTTVNIIFPKKLVIFHEV